MKKINSVYNYPFLLFPCGKDYIWGGSKLKEKYNKNINIEHLAETWECSTNLEGHCIVNSGKYKGKTLKYVLDKYPEFLGTKLKENKEFPILIKFIDAKQNLSIQVHPTKDYTDKHEKGKNGKAEMWYVLEAEPNSYIINGFKEEVTKEEIKEAIKRDELEKFLNKVEVKKGDSFFIDSGVVHSIGKGIVILEIQENSNLTYRIYDYKRKNRELNINKALDVIKYEKCRTNTINTGILKNEKGHVVKQIYESKYFTVIKEELEEQISILQTDTTSFHVLVVIEGKGKIELENNKINIKKGDCIFVPANTMDLKIHGTLEFINVNY